MRHIEIRELWLQKEVEEGKVLVDKLLGTENPVDLMTKILTGVGIEDRVKGMSLVMRDRYEGKTRSQNPQGIAETEGVNKILRTCECVIERYLDREREIEICCVILCEGELRMSGETKNASMSYHQLNGEELHLVRDIKKAP